MNEKPSTLKSLNSKKDSGSLPELISPEKSEKIFKEFDTHEKNETVPEDEKITAKALSSVSEANIHTPSENVLKEELDTFTHSSALEDWFTKIKKLEVSYNDLKETTKIRIGSSYQSELRDKSLEVKATTKKLEKEIYDWFEEIYATTKKLDSTFVLNNIKRPTLSIKKTTTEGEFLSPK